MENTTAIPLVTVKCMAYNQGAYIRQCLESLVSQKTDFPFEVLVHDDASTDNTADIIRDIESKYPNIVHAIYEQENQYSRGGNYHHKATDPYIRGKYLAFCEGDDYWCDPNKLQKQIDFLRSHPNCVLCHTYKKTYIQIQDKFVSESHLVLPEGSALFDYLLHEHCGVSFLTAMMPSQIYRDYLEEINPGEHRWKMGDYPLWLFCATRGDFGLIQEETAVYRQLPQSACHTDSARKRFAFVKSYHDIQLFFAEKYSHELPVWDGDKIFYNICHQFLRNHYSPENLAAYREAYDLLPDAEKTTGRRLARRLSGNRILFTIYFAIVKRLKKFFS